MVAKMIGLLAPAADSSSVHNDGPMCLGSICAMFSRMGVGLLEGAPQSPLLCS